MNHSDVIADLVEISRSRAHPDAAASVVMLIGENDTGKSTLASAIVESGAWDKAGLVDADVGQGTLAPPGCIGAAIVEGGRRESAGAWFVGNVSPVRHIAAVCEGARQLVDRLRLDEPSLIVIDTCGLVRGKIGVVLKQRLIRTCKPNVVIGVQRSGELDPVLTPFTRSVDTSIIVRSIAPADTVGKKKSTFRRRVRQQRTAEALDHAVDRVFTSDESVEAAGIDGLLVGLLAADGMCLGIGRLLAVNGPSLSISTACDALDIVTAVRLGDLQIGADGSRLGEVRVRPGLLRGRFAQPTGGVIR